jgi:hypothetical protein
MMRPDPNVAVFVCVTPVDMRKQAATNSAKSAHRQPSAPNVPYKTRTLYAMANH